MTEQPQRQRVKKSVITCDMEGRIETFNANAEEFFGYTADEVIGKARVSLFSPGLIVLGHVNTWLKTAVDEGEYKSRTVFRRKDGTQFPAEIRITPTFRNGEQIGYCGITTPLDDTPVAEAMPRISWATRVFAGMVVVRAPFLTAALVPMLIGGAWVAYEGLVASFPWLLFLLALVGGVALQIAANTFNDYYDWRSGTDPANNNYFLPFTGGSRSLELGLITERALFRIGVAASLVAVLVGLVILAVQGPGILLFGAMGLFAALFYTAPPLRLVARRGLGELLVGLSFGPLMTAGTVFALSGTVRPIDFLLGVPIGLLTAAILWINEVPDTPSDVATGKLHLVATLGEANARWGYLALLGVAYALLGAAVAFGPLPATVLLAWLTLPVAVYATVILFRHYADRTLVRANAATIGLHLLFGVLSVVGILAGGLPAA